jgi:hypothetical protein
VKPQRQPKLGMLLTQMRSRTDTLKSSWYTEEGSENGSARQHSIMGNSAKILPRYPLHP